MCLIMFSLPHVLYNYILILHDLFLFCPSFFISVRKLPNLNPAPSLASETGKTSHLRQKNTILCKIGISVEALILYTARRMKQRAGSKPRRGTP